MEFLSSNLVILTLCGIVILSYLFSLLSLKTKVPSVILLLLTGILAKQALLLSGFQFDIPRVIIEILGTVGLIMIILEAGLELKINKEKTTLIRSSLFAALFIMFLSVVLVAMVIKFWLDQPMLNSVIYALPLSVISGAIVIPSVNHLTPYKKEFLVYESSFSDIIGILVFNFIIVDQALSFLNFGMFFINIIIAIVVSLIISYLLLLLITRTIVNAKFFLIFAILITLYVSGKIINLPSLIIILVFGLLVSNWNSIKNKRLISFFPHEQIEGVHTFLHSITTESSFLIRTFFFILFGFSINVSLLMNKEIIIVGSAIVLALFTVRFLYLKLFLKSNIFPELFYMPRGLITILLFYKIPTQFQLSAFNEGILFFVVLSTSLIMMFGAVFYKTEKGKPLPDEYYE
jgi:Kef-type K+ transport system membrane component KefB